MLNNNLKTGIANPLWTWFTASNWTANLWTSIKEWVKNWQNTAKVTQEQKTKDYFEKRQKINNDITTWKITSWSPAQDTLMVRKNNLVQLFAADALEKGANPDKVVALTKKPDEVLKRLTSLGNEQANAINNYLMKGWYADRVFDYAIGNTKSPYEEREKEEDKNLIQKGMDWVKGTALGNFAASALSVPVQSAANLEWLLWWDYADKKELKAYSDFLWTISTEEYNKYKNESWLKKLWGKATNTWLHDDTEASDYKEWDKTFFNSWTQSRADFYKWYEEAKEKGFDGSVEDYANFMRDMATETITWISDATKNFLENEVYDPNKVSAKLGKVGWEIGEMAFLPAFKLKWLDKAWKVGKIAKWAVNLAAEWAEIQWFEDLYNKQLSDAGKYTTAMKWNVWLGWILKWLWGWVSWLPTKEAETIANKTTKEWNAMSKITDNWNKRQNQEITPYTEITDLLKKGKEAVSKDRVKAWWELESTRKFDLEYWDAPYTAKDAVEKDLTEAFTWLKDPKKMWGEVRWPNAQLPEFSVSKSWRTLNIKNPETLNRIVKTDWDKTIKLWDEIKNIWSEMFNKNDMQINATTTDLFIRKVKNVLKDEWWKWVSWEWMKTVRQVFKNWDTKFKESLSPESATKLSETSSASKWWIELDNAFDEIIWRLNWTKWLSSDVNPNSFSKWQVEKLFTDIYNATKWKIDLNNEVWAWVLNVSLRDPKKAQQLLETIYPSQPWATEFIIKSFMNKAKRAWAKTYTKDYKPSAWSRMSESLPWRIWATMFWWL